MREGGEPASEAGGEADPTESRHGDAAGRGPEIQGREPTAEALRQLLSGPDLTPMELCKLLDVNSEEFMEYWDGSRSMTKAMALRVARILEDRARTLLDRASELRTAVWRLPSI